MTTQTDSKANTSQLMAIWRAASVPLTAVILALLVGAAILLISGANPIAAYTALAKGAFGSSVAFGRTLEKATPLILG
ncbi:MAG: ABC transporter permease, partial [Anaerolineae bacterium]|nr:ABC transporter permease [Anaerolineae bacterium]